MVAHVPSKHIHAYLVEKKKRLGVDRANVFGKWLRRDTNKKNALRTYALQLTVSLQRHAKYRGRYGRMDLGTDYVLLCRGASGSAHVTHTRCLTGA